LFFLTIKFFHGKSVLSFYFYYYFFVMHDDLEHQYLNWILLGRYHSLIFKFDFAFFFCLLLRLPFGYQQEYDSTNSIVISKYFLTNILLFAYTSQLCLTTVCTPSIYLNWFLIVTDCRYVYSYTL